MPSPLGITLMSMGQPSASCGHQASNVHKGRSSHSVHPLLDQALSAPSAPFPFSIYTPTPRPSH